MRSWNRYVSDVRNVTIVGPFSSPQYLGHLRNVDVLSGLRGQTRLDRCVYATRTRTEIDARAAKANQLCLELVVRAPQTRSAYWSNRRAGQRCNAARIVQNNHVAATAVAGRWFLRKARSLGPELRGARSDDRVTFSENVAILYTHFIHRASIHSRPKARQYIGDRSNRHVLRDMWNILLLGYVVCCGE